MYSGVAFERRRFLECLNRILRPMLSDVTIKTLLTLCLSGLILGAPNEKK